MKHKIEYTEGCTVTNCTIDGVDIYDTDSDTKESVLRGIVDNMYDSEMIDIIVEYCRYHGDEKFESHCNECGDNIIKYTVEVDC